MGKPLDLDITEYICVDWAAMVQVIDNLGGLDLDITEAEMGQINKYKKDIDKVTGMTTPELTQYGSGVHLNGTQATTYARIRKLAGDDFKRASRQRIVLQAMLEKAKKADVGTLLSICNSVVDDISILCLPELCLTGYTANDLFETDSLLSKSQEAIRAILSETKDIPVLFAFGAPLRS